MITSEQIVIARGNWLKASKELQFKITTPFYLDINGVVRSIFAYLPDYGSQNGTIVELTSAPNYETNKYIKEWAQIKNCFYSFINIEETLVYNRKYFKEILEDWIKYESIYKRQK